MQGITVRNTIILGIVFILLGVGVDACCKKQQKERDIVWLLEHSA